jgi:GTPase SAR1 family protein
VVQRYIHGRPPAESYAPTVMDQFAYAVNVGDRTIQVHLWDTRTLRTHPHPLPRNTPHHTPRPRSALTWIVHAEMWQNVDADCYLLCFDLSDMSALARIQDKVRRRPPRTHTTAHAHICCTHVVCRVSCAVCRVPCVV